MERANAYVGSPVTRWRTRPLERQRHWLLRLGVVGCCIGYGVDGLLRKEVWVFYSCGVGSNRTYCSSARPSELPVPGIPEIRQRRTNMQWSV